MRQLFLGMVLPVALLVSGGASAQRMAWVAVLLIYQAPADSINWHGPWTRGMTIAGKEFFSSELACKTNTEARIAKLHEGMMAPVLYRCVPFQESLP